MGKVIAQVSELRKFMVCKIRHEVMSIPTLNGP